MRPSIGVIDYCNPSLSAEQHKQVIKTQNLTVLAANAEGKAFLVNDTTVYVLIPVYLKGNDKNIWLEGKAAEYHAHYQHKMDFFDGHHCMILEQ